MRLTQEQTVRFVVKPLLLLACLAPALGMAAGSIGFGGTSLGANPVEALLHGLGKWGLNFLFLTLCISPLRQITGWVHWMRFRRMLGLTAFFYLFGHFAFYLAVDRGLDLRLLTEDVIERPYITVGLAGLLLLVPLAATSTRASMRRLGRRWQTLHRLVYPAAVLGCVHYYWQVKADVREPLIYFTVLAGLLGWRWWKHRERLSRAAPSSPPRAALTSLSPATARGHQDRGKDEPTSGCGPRGHRLVQ